MHIDEFNTADVAAATGVVSVWAAVPEWVESIVGGRPYVSVDELAERATELAKPWGPAELDLALAHHPRIGQRATGHSAEETASRQEQSSMSGATATVTERIAAGNVAYEERFGRIFLIRAAGRTPENMLAELERRLLNEPDAEASEAAAQLAEIALLRLRGSIEPTTSNQENA